MLSIVSTQNKCFNVQKVIQGLWILSKNKKYKQPLFNSMPLEWLVYTFYTKTQRFYLFHKTNKIETHFIPLNKERTVDDPRDLF